MATVIGVVIGLIFSLLFARVMASLLYGAGSGNWLVFVAVALMLLLIALVASYIPPAKRPSWIP